MKIEKKKTVTYTKPEWARQALVNLNHEPNGFSCANEFPREDPPRRPIDLEILMKGVAELLKSKEAEDSSTSI